MYYRAVRDTTSNKYVCYVAMYRKTQNPIDQYLFVVEGILTEWRWQSLVSFSVWMFF